MTTRIQKIAVIGAGVGFMMVALSAIGARYTPGIQPQRTAPPNPAIVAAPNLKFYSAVVNSCHNGILTTTFWPWNNSLVDINKKFRAAVYFNGKLVGEILYNTGLSAGGKASKHINGPVTPNVPKRRGGKVRANVVKFVVDSKEQIAESKENDNVKYVATVCN